MQIATQYVGYGLILQTVMLLTNYTRLFSNVTDKLRNDFVNSGLYLEGMEDSCDVLLLLFCLFGVGVFSEAWLFG